MGRGCTLTSCVRAMLSLALPVALTVRARARCARGCRISSGRSRARDLLKRTDPSSRALLLHDLSRSLLCNSSRFRASHTSEKMTHRSPHRRPLSGVRARALAARPLPLPPPLSHAAPPLCAHVPASASSHPAHDSHHVDERRRAQDGPQGAREPGRRPPPRPDAQRGQGHVPHRGAQECVHSALWTLGGSAR